MILTGRQVHRRNTNKQIYLTLFSPYYIRKTSWGRISDRKIADLARVVMAAGGTCGRIILSSAQN